MSRWRAEKIGLEIGGQAIVLRRAGARQPLAAAAGDWPAMAAELAQLLPARARLSVRVADCWVRYCLLEPPAGSASLRDCRLLLDARFEALYGHSPADWLLQADWQAGRPMLACAIPRSLRQAFTGLSLVSLERLVPALLEDWNHHCRALPETGVWCGTGDGMLNLLYWEQGSLRLVRQQRGGDANALLALELARLGAAMPQARFCSGDAMPEGWRRMAHSAELAA